MFDSVRLACSLLQKVAPKTHLLAKRIMYWVCSAACRECCVIFQSDLEHTLSQLVVDDDDDDEEDAEAETHAHSVPIVRNLVFSWLINAYVISF